MKKYYQIPSYTMKCRMYLNNKQKELFGTALYALRVVYNCTLYDMKKNFECTKERKNSKTNNEVLHFPDFSYAASAERLNKLRKVNPVVKCVKAYALSGKNGIIQSDLKRSFAKIMENKTGKFKSGQSLPLEFIDYNELRFINNKKPRTSMTFQIHGKNVYLKENKNGEINRNVLYVDLGKFGDSEFGEVKIRGWNKRIRFDKDGETDFASWLSNNLGKAITITLSVDNCGNYWICFKFAYSFNKVKKIYEGIPVYKKFEEQNKKETVGLDVGKKTLITCSNDKAFTNGEVENKKFKALEREHLKVLNKKLSRKDGWSNIKFREKHKENKDLSPSKSYEKTKLKLAKLNRKIVRKRENYYNYVSKKIIETYGFIGIESLSVKEMFNDPRTEEQKDVNSEMFIPKRFVKRTNENTSDASMSKLLQMIKYKADWYERVCQEIGRYFPSSKQCHKCGYIKRDLTLKDRYWTCPECGITHDRDRNASIGVELEALRIYSESN